MPAGAASVVRKTRPAFVPTAYVPHVGSEGANASVTMPAPDPKGSGLFDAQTPAPSVVRQTLSLPAISTFELAGHALNCPMNGPTPVFASVRPFTALEYDSPPSIVLKMARFWPEVYHVVSGLVASMTHAAPSPKVVRSHAVDPFMRGVPLSWAPAIARSKLLGSSAAPG